MNKSPQLSPKMQAVVDCRPLSSRTPVRRTSTRTSGSLRPVPIRLFCATKGLLPRGAPLWIQVQGFCFLDSPDWYLCLASEACRLGLATDVSLPSDDSSSGQTAPFDLRDHDTNGLRPLLDVSAHVVQCSHRGHSKSTNAEIFFKKTSPKALAGCCPYTLAALHVGPHKSPPFPHVNLSL